MSSPTPSDAAVSSLLRGESLNSGKAVVERLGANAMRLLGTLWEQRAEFLRRKGAEQVGFLRHAYSANSGSPVEGCLPPRAAAGDAALVAKTLASRWRLERLRCYSIRGVAPLGEEFEFNFDGQSVLIYGPNGSGKSSLLNAIGWVFTCKAVTDCEGEAEHVPLYATPKAGAKATKLRDWPVIHTLPQNLNPKNVEPDCRAELSLKSEDGTRTLHLRRTTGTLEESADGESWVPCPGLATHGITPLDVQLSITAATVFGRRSIEASPDTRHLLSMMLG